jgi:hypothetical protein
MDYSGQPIADLPPEERELYEQNLLAIKHERVRKAFAILASMGIDKETFKEMVREAIPPVVPDVFPF